MICCMEEKEILKRIITNDALFNNIHVVQQRFEIVPSDKEHIGAFIEFQDLQDRHQEFLEELIDSVVDWVYSAEKFQDLLVEFQKRGKSARSASASVVRKAHEKFRKPENPDQLLSQGQFGELLLFHFIQRYMNAVPLLRKMNITTSPHHERFGADAIHFKVQDGKNVIILGEAKTYTSKHSFSSAFENAINSILSTYDNHKKEINLYVHEDFLDKELNQIAEDYLSNKLPNCEVHLVCIVTYEENKKVTFSNQEDIRRQIVKIIEERFSSFDNSKIDIENNPILNRITYIVFPVWGLENLVKEFQTML